MIFLSYTSILPTSSLGRRSIKKFFLIFKYKFLASSFSSTISIDNDLSLQKSNDISEIIMKSKTGPIQEENDLSTSKIKNERNISFSNTNYSNNNMNSSTNEIIDSRQNAFISQANQIIKNLNAFEDCINNDFDDLEQFVENEIEKELTTTYR